jgi:Putative zinc-finger
VPRRRAQALPGALCANRGRDECERWTPLLSKLVDGEADADELLAIRPHLRACSACRASIRALRESAPALGVLMPPALLVGLAVGAAANGGVLARLSDLLGGLLPGRGGGAKGAGRWRRRHRTRCPVAGFPIRL